MKLNSIFNLVSLKRIRLVLWLYAAVTMLCVLYDSFKYDALNNSSAPFLTVGLWLVAALLAMCVGAMLLAGFRFAKQREGSYSILGLTLSVIALVAIVIGLVQAYVHRGSFYKLGLLVNWFINAELLLTYGLLALAVLAAMLLPTILPYIKRTKNVG